MVSYKIWFTGFLLMAFNDAIYGRSLGNEAEKAVTGIPCSRGPPYECVWFQHCSDGYCRLAQCKTTADCASDELCMEGKCVLKLRALQGRNVQHAEARMVQPHQTVSNHDTNRRIIDHSNTATGPSSKHSTQGREIHPQVFHFPSSILTSHTQHPPRLSGSHLDFDSRAEHYYGASEKHHAGENSQTQIDVPQSNHHNQYLPVPNTRQHFNVPQQHLNLNSGAQSFSMTTGNQMNQQPRFYYLNPVKAEAPGYYQKTQTNSGYQNPSNVYNIHGQQMDAAPNFYEETVSQNTNGKWVHTPNGWVWQSNVNQMVPVYSYQYNIGIPTENNKASSSKNEVGELPAQIRSSATRQQNNKRKYHYSADKMNSRIAEAALADTIIDPLNGPTEPLHHRAIVDPKKLRTMEILYDAVKRTSKQTDISQCESNKQVDLVILMDQSKSMGGTNFKKLKEFIKKIILSFSINDGHTQVAIVPYSTRPDLQNIIRLNNYRTTSEILKAVDRVQYKSGRTGTGSGLKFIQEEILQEKSGMRPQAEKIVVVITDGITNTGPQPSVHSKILAERGVKLYAVGVKGASGDELKSIAQTSRNVLNFRNFDAMKFDAVALSICRNI